MIVLMSVDCCWVSFLNPIYRAMWIKVIPVELIGQPSQFLRKSLYPSTFLTTDTFLLSASALSLEYRKRNFVNSINSFLVTLQPFYLGRGLRLSPMADD
jgi:hypothetical protein